MYNNNKLQMNYETLLYVKLPVSRFVLGTAFMPMFLGDNDAAFNVLDAAYTMGINTFDTARMYGEAERVLGDWMEKHKNREDITILTKGCNPTRENPHRCTPEALQEDIEGSFKMLRTDYIDIYLLHRDDHSAPVEPIVEILNEYHAAGKIGAFGGSNWTTERIEEANVYACAQGMIPFTVSEPCFSLAEQIGDPWGGSIHISGPHGAPARSWYKENDMPIFAYSSLARGFLSGKYHADDFNTKAPDIQYGMLDEYYFPDNIERLRRCEQLAKNYGVTVPEIALAWELKQPMRVFPIISPSRVEHLEKNILALDLKLTDEQCLWLDLKLENLGSSVF